MALSAADVAEYLKVMRQHGATKLKVEGLEVELDEAEPLSEGPSVEPSQPIGLAQGYPTAEEMLHWSSPLGPPPIAASPPEEP